MNVKPKRRWFRQMIGIETWIVCLWTIWGSLLGLAVGLIDVSWVEGLLCLAVGVIVGLFGFPLWLLIGMVFRFRRKSPRDLQWDYDAPEYSAANRMADGQLDLLDPKRKLRDTYPALVVCFGGFHGLLVGPLFGAFVPLAFDLSTPAWQGAAWGSLFGPLVVGCIAAITLTTSEHRPSIDGIRPLVRAAAEETIRLGHETYAISHEHLLIALLRHPSPALDAVWSETSADLDRLADHIGAEMDQPVIRVDTDDEFEKSSYGILCRAIERASTAGQPTVDAGHVFLALAHAWPDLTRETLSAAGLEMERVLKELDEELKALV